MDKKNKIYFYFCASLFSILFMIYAFPCYAQYENKSLSNDGISSISKADLYEHLKFLTSPECAGRGNGQQGLQIAAEYISDKFKGYGLSPLKGNDNYFQTFNWLEMPQNERAIFKVFNTTGDTIRFADGHVDCEPSWLSANGRIEGNLAFVGYGISKEDYDDYEGIDVTNKIVLIMRHEPHLQKSNEAKQFGLLTEHSRLSRKILNAQQHGAKGAIIFTDPDSYEKYYHDRKLKNFYYEFANNATWKNGSDQIQIPAIYAYYHTAKSLFRIYDIEQIQAKIDSSYQPHSLLIEGMTAIIDVEINCNVHQVQNVVGMIPGCDPELQDEIVVVGAHYDHLGIFWRDKRVYPGADDNASGTSAILEIAQAFSLIKESPKRSIIFIAFAAEEPTGAMGGCDGSEYFLRNLNETSKKMFALINFDMIGRNRDHKVTLTGWLKNLVQRKNPNEILITGTSFCNKLRRICDVENQKIGMDLKFHHIKEDTLALMLAGDHNIFFKRKIPIISFYDEMKSDCHSEKDTMDKINFKKMEKVTKLGFLVAWKLANLQDNLIIEKDVWLKECKRSLSANADY